MSRIGSLATDDFGLAMSRINSAVAFSIALGVVACTRAERSAVTIDTGQATIGGVRPVVESTPTQTAGVAGWPMEGARVLERQLQRELFNSSDTGFVDGAVDCDDGGEEMPPPGLALVRARLADSPVVAVDGSRRATIRTILTSVASTAPHEGGDQTDVDVVVGPRVDTVDILIERRDNGFALCYTQLYLRRNHLSWAVVRKWTPPAASWDSVMHLADSLSQPSPPG